MVKDTTHLGHVTQIIQAGSNMKRSFLQSSLHGIRNDYAIYQGGETITSPTQLQWLWTTTMVQQAGQDISKGLMQ